MIVGRMLGSTFPPKSDAHQESDLLGLVADRQRLPGHNFRGGAGQIVGVAGVAGNGQSELMRALAGLQPSEGAISLQGDAENKELLQEAAFMPSDRHTEGLATGLTVRENASFAALDNSPRTGS